MGANRLKPKEKMGKEKTQVKRGHARPRNLTVNKRKRKSQTTDARRKTKGPRLPSALRKELDLLNSKRENSDEEIDSDDADEERVERNDVYEYDEAVPEEESKKNRRFDPVDNLEYELPEDFEDENVPSSEEDSDDNSCSDEGRKKSDVSDDEVEEDDGDRHSRMLQGITGMPSEAFEGKKRKAGIVSEAFPESQYDLNLEESDGPITLEDLIDPLHGKPGYSKLRKTMYQLGKDSQELQAPLPKPERERLERKAAYEQSKKDINKWAPLVKKNREAPTIFFDEDTNVGYSTVGAIASEFEPRTEFEQKMTSLFHDPEIAEAHEKDGARLLELNLVSVQDVKERQNRLAKMRSLLFRHEVKAKHIKKIKSKTYHRILKKDRLKVVSAQVEADPEAAKELARKQEFKRAEERMTLKHKNSSKWAKRALKRGLSKQDEATRAAISEQLHMNASLTRKMHSMNDTSSDDESSDADEDDNDSDSDGEHTSKVLKQAKEQTLRVIEEEDEVPKTGVLSLPFMVRGLKKKQDAAYEEAQLALEEYDSKLRSLEDEAEVENLAASSGRRVFGKTKPVPKEVVDNRMRKRDYDAGSDEEEGFKTNESIDLPVREKIGQNKEAEIDPSILLEDFGTGYESVLKGTEHIAENPRPKSTFEVAIFASDSFKKIDTGKVISDGNRNSLEVSDPALPSENPEEEDHNSDTDIGEIMVDGILSYGSKSEYELPSQAELRREAFAGDDVEGEFEKYKMDVVNEENPEPEKPVLLPGWGQWTHIQEKRGLPSWMLQEHESAKKKREEALKKRKDSHLKHVIISEKVDRKAEKLLSKTLPFPYTSKEVYEQSVRMPIGPEFNPATSHGVLIRPAVVKTSGVIVKPIQFQEVDPHEKAEDNAHAIKSEKSKKTRGAGGKKAIKTKRK